VQVYVCVCVYVCVDYSNGHNTQIPVTVIHIEQIYTQGEI